MKMAIVDVRDVAKAHVLAMKNPQTDGQRIILSAVPSLWFKEMAKVLDKEFQPQGIYFLVNYNMFRISSAEESLTLSTALGVFVFQRGGERNFRTYRKRSAGRQFQGM